MIDGFGYSAKNAVFFIFFMTAVFPANLPAASFAQVETEAGEFWHCSGYCFMGGDTATNPWVPVSATGADETEARDNIDCGPFIEVGISCRKIRNQAGNLDGISE